MENLPWEIFEKKKKNLNQLYLITLVQEVAKLVPLTCEVRSVLHWIQLNVFYGI